jgi:hypothetical protein
VNLRSPEGKRLVEEQKRLIVELGNYGYNIYYIAARLNLPSKPRNILHLPGKVAASVSDLETCQYLLKARRELTRLTIEARAARDGQWSTLKQGEIKKPTEDSGGKSGENMQPTSETTKGKAEAIRDQVFICYSHKDKPWLDELQSYLKPYVQNRKVTVWSDENISPGAEWFEEIKRALAWTKVAVLLVTKDFLASEFIHEHELTPFVKEAEKGNVCIIWIPVRACAYKETPLRNYQAAIGPDKPLANMKKADRDKAWVKVCDEIKKAVSC